MVYNYPSENVKTDYNDYNARSPSGISALRFYSAKDRPLPSILCGSRVDRRQAAVRSIARHLASLAHSWQAPDGATGLEVRRSDCRAGRRPDRLVPADLRVKLEWG